MSRQTPILRGHIEQGELVWAGIDGKRFETAKQFLEQQEFELTIQKRRKRRSLNQNAYMWTVVIPRIAKAAGYSGTKEENEMVHDGLRARFLSQPTDGPLAMIRSTTSLTTVEMEDYLEKCRQFAAEFYGIYVPNPNEAATMGEFA